MHHVKRVYIVSDSAYCHDNVHQHKRRKELEAEHIRILQQYVVDTQKQKEELEAKMQEEMLNVKKKSKPS